MKRTGYQNNTDYKQRDTTVNQQECNKSLAGVWLTAKGRLFCSKEILLINNFTQINYIFLFILLFTTFSLSAKLPFEEIIVPGIENPTALTLSPDGLTMILVDQPRKGLMQLKQTVRPHLASTWSYADPIASVLPLISSETLIEGPCFSFDGKEVYFAANFSGSLGGMDIWSISKTESGWTQPRNLGAPINSSAHESYPSISGNKRSFYFTRETAIKKLNDFRCGELWTSELDSTSTHWCEPLKINTVINSGGIAYPKIQDDNKTILYAFITNDKMKWDIYWTKRFIDKHWYLPLPIDTLVSKESEVSPVYSKADGFLYFIYNEGSDARFKSSLLRFRIPENFIPEKTIWLKGQVLDDQNKCPVQARLEVTDPVLGTLQAFQLSDQQTGRFEMLLNAGLTYMLHVSKPGYSQQYKLLTPPHTDSDLNINLSVFPTVELVLNTYDHEVLRPLEARIEVYDVSGKLLPVTATPLEPGQQKLILPIGTDYTIKALLDFYHPNTIEVGLSTAVLFDRFVRDIELEPVKRKIEFFVTDTDTHLPIEAQIIFTGWSGKNNPKPETVPGQTGLYNVTLLDGLNYPIDVRGPKGYIFYHTEIDLKTNPNLSRLDIALEKFKIKVPVRLNNINFEFNSADLIESSFPELNRLIKLMTDNPDLRIEISAHTDDIGSDQYNDILSEKRALSVVRYLIENGIANTRLVSKGYGKKAPLVPNNSDENRALNRRVEMKILDFELFETIIPD